MLDLWKHRWLWLAGCTIALAIAGALVGRAIWGRSYVATAELIHYEPSAIDDTFHPRDLATPSLVVMLQSPGMLQDLGAQLQPPVSGRELADHLQVTLDRNNEVATVAATARTREGAADLVQRFCAAAIAYTQAMQRQEAVEAGDSVTRQLAQVEHEIETTRETIPAASTAAVAALAASPGEDTPAAAASDLPQRIQTAREQLDDLLVRYTDAHPLVLEQRARLAALEDLQRRSPAAAPVRSSFGRRPESPSEVSPALEGLLTPEEIAMGERLRSLETSRALLIGRRRAIQPFRDDPPGYFRVLRPASENPILQLNHRLETIVGGCLGAFLGLMGAAGQILLGEFLDNRIKSRADVRRVTGLPLLAALGDLKRLSPAERDQAAFRAWIALQSRLNPSPPHGLVCGITSTQRGEGRSTWIDLLARAATAGGFRVLTITGEAASAAAAEPASLWSTPGQLAGRLLAADGPAPLHLPLPGGEWNAERRRQWHSALEAWSAIDHLAIFIELPPASGADCVLLAEKLPNILWLAESGRSGASETFADLETLRAARCHLVGAVLNRERAEPVRGRFSRWIGIPAMLLAASLSLPAPRASAQDAFSVVGPARQADWQRHLTLGPGDVVSFHFFGAPELTREEVPIGPDGRISYLEADNILAAGLTIDELRGRVNDELGKYRRAPQAYVTPDVYHSKKYYMLGTVVATGIYYLDQPTTIIEAVARSRGFVTGESHGDTVETTDFSRSFLERRGQRMPVDLERLFRHGDLSQNIALEPDDYLYFPPAAAGQIYVLGEVLQPGALAFDADTTTLSAIAARGGFTDRAWKKRVLVVRGSLDHPQALTVDVGGALNGQAPNLALEPGDLVYVSSRPWAKAMDLLDHAAQAFVESTVVTWTGINVGPDIISRPSHSP
jgi:protein involved in polysaccharide export with SLBB domain/capsular polysaccharide biosynthesis protein